MAYMSTAGIVIRNKKIFMALRNPGGAQGDRWEFPGGKVDEGETPEQGLAREYKEEFGLQLTVGRGFFESRFMNGQKQFQLLAFLGELDGTTPVVLPEHQTTRWFTLEETSQLKMADSDIPILEYLLENRREFKL